MTTLRTRHEGVSWDDWPEEDRKQMMTVLKLFSRAATECYFTSGAYTREEEAKGREVGVNAVYMSESERRHFYTWLHDVFLLLADIGEVSIAHDVLKTLAQFIDIEPDGILRIIGHAIRMTIRSGYQYEVLAVDLVVEIIERYLAEYRELFRESAMSRVLLLDILDEFIAVGWPRAHRLVYRLDSIYR